MSPSLVIRHEQMQHVIPCEDPVRRARRNALLHEAGLKLYRWSQHGNCVRDLSSHVTAQGLPTQNIQPLVAAPVQRKSALAARRMLTTIFPSSVRVATILLLGPSQCLRVLFNLLNTDNERKRSLVGAENGSEDIVPRGKYSVEVEVMWFRDCWNVLATSQDARLYLWIFSSFGTCREGFAINAWYGMPP